MTSSSTAWAWTQPGLEPPPAAGSLAPPRTANVTVPAGTIGSSAVIIDDGLIGPLNLQNRALGTLITLEYGISLTWPATSAQLQVALRWGANQGTYSNTLSFALGYPAFAAGASLTGLMRGLFFRTTGTSGAGQVQLVLGSVSAAAAPASITQFGPLSGITAASVNWIVFGIGWSAAAGTAITVGAPRLTWIPGQDTT